MSKIFVKSKLFAVIYSNGNHLGSSLKHAAFRHVSASKCAVVLSSSTRVLQGLGLSVQEPLKAAPSSKKLHAKASLQQDVTFVERFVNGMPPGIQPYMRLTRMDKPIGTWLLLWPCYWSIGMATAPGHLPDPYWICLFGAGAFLMRGAGCILNDMWDKDIDVKVTRTKQRPLASGQITMLDAWMLLGGQLSLALLVLLQLNLYSIVLGSSSLFLVVTYPLVKRFSYWPQLMLGLTFNWGAFLGWSALQGSCDWTVVLPLYAAGISWTMIYDTIYAHQDKVDDVLVKVKSTALLFKERTKLWLSLFAATSTTCFAASGYFAGQTWPYYAAVVAAAGMFTKQINSLDIDNPEDCWQKFKSNQRVGWIIFLGIISGTWLKGYTQDTSQSSIRDKLSVEKLHPPALHIT